MKMDVPDLELIHSWLVGRLDKDNLAFARQRGLDLRAMIRTRIESFAARFTRTGYVVISLVAVIFYFLGGSLLRSRGMITDWVGEIMLVLAVCFGLVVGFAAVRFQAAYTFYNIERRIKAKNDLTLQYLLSYVAHDIQLLRQPKTK